MFTLIFFIAFAATFFGSLSGSSSSIISIPCWLTLGFPLPTAIASDKVSGTFWTALASRNYLAGKTIDKVLLCGLAVFGIFGAVLGTQVTVSLNSTITKPIVGILVIAAVLVSWLKPEFGVANRPAEISKPACSMLGLPLGFYEGFFGSGNSIFTSLILCKTRGFSLLTALGHYYFLAFIWCACAATSYIAKGFGNITLMLPAVLGSVLGGQIGSHVGRNIGAGVVKKLFTVTGLFFGFKLLIGF
jgi:uncharacterized membrane protein YfcA